ncbi:MAG: hypothetical protein AB9869_26490 [Verrucomicrobiia bacterium]
MRDSKLLVIAILAVATAWQLCAQTASPELQRQALEVLRQAVAQQEAAQAAQQTKAAPAQGTKVSSTQARPPSTPAQPHSTVVAPAAPKALPPQVRPEPTHQGQEGWQPSTRVVPRVSSPRGAANAPAPSRPQATNPAGSDAKRQVGQAQGPGTAVVPQASSGAGTKQQRLDELLKRYLADEITPAEYHAERRRIVGGP